VFAGSCGMTLRKAIGGILCLLRDHKPGRKFCREHKWYRACQRCGDVKTADAPKKRVKAVAA
jgi:hypothetical protein